MEAALFDGADRCNDVCCGDKLIAWTVETLVIMQKVLNRPGTEVLNRPGLIHPQNKLKRSIQESQNFPPLSPKPYPNNHHDNNMPTTTLL